MSRAYFLLKRSNTKQSANSSIASRPPRWPAPAGVVEPASAAGRQTRATVNPLLTCALARAWRVPCSPRAFPLDIPRLYYALSGLATRRLPVCTRVGQRPRFRVASESGARGRLRGQQRPARRRMPFAEARAEAREGGRLRERHLSAESVTPSTVCGGPPPPPPPRPNRGKGGASSPPDKGRAQRGPAAAAKGLYPGYYPRRICTPRVFETGSAAPGKPGGGSCASAGLDAPKDRRAAPLGTFPRGHGSVLRFSVRLVRGGASGRESARASVRAEPPRPQGGRVPFGGQRDPLGPARSVRSGASQTAQHPSRSDPDARARSAPQFPKPNRKLRLDLALARACVEATSS